MYSQLKLQMLKDKIANKQIAEMLQITRETVSNKIHRKTAFTVDEAIKIQQHFFPSVPIDVLFRCEL